MKDAKDEMNLEMVMEMNMDMKDMDVDMKLEKKEDKVEEKKEDIKIPEIKPKPKETKPNIAINNILNNRNPPIIPQLPQNKIVPKLNGVNNANINSNNTNTNANKNNNFIKSPEEIKKLSEAIKRLSKTEVYYINLLKESNPEITDSKLGGLPYWSNKTPYPKNMRGKNLYLLAQINFEKEKTTAPFPSTGILQFFIDGEDIQTFGANFEGDQTKQKNFRIVYHDTIDSSVTRDSVKNLGLPTNIGKIDFPVQGEHKITLEKDSEYSNLYDIRFNGFFSEAYKEVYNKDLEKNKKFLDVLGFEGEDKLEMELEPKEDKTRHKMLGYASFTQEDPRYKGMYKDYDTLLLQIDTEWNYIIWGDCGICNFFIKKQDLINKNFSKVLFNWDCS